jgi:hypothetical protein
MLSSVYNIWETFNESLRVFKMGNKSTFLPSPWNNASGYILMHQVT